MNRRGFLFGTAAAIATIPLAHATPLQIIKALPPAPPDILNIMDFGAIGDGVADDLPAINRALEAARRIGVPTVFMPPGTYRTSGPVVLNFSDGVGLRGSGPESCITTENVCLEYRT